MTEIVEELLGFFGGDFERAGKPAAEGAVEQGIADKEHEDDGKKGDGHGAQNHLGFEARPELFLAALGPKANETAGEDEAEDEERGGDKAGDGIEGNDFAPRLRLEGNIEGAHGEDGGKKQRDEDAAKDELDAEFVASGTHVEASGGVGRNCQRAQLEQIA